MSEMVVQKPLGAVVKGEKLYLEIRVTDSTAHGIRGIDGSGYYFDVIANGKAKVWVTGKAKVWVTTNPPGVLETAQEWEDEK